MLGTRGVRLGLIHPEIYEMQARAIFRAARAVRERTGRAPRVEIMIPLVAYAARARDGARPRAARGRRGGRHARSRLQRRHDDRAAARVPRRRRDRRATPSSSPSAPTTSRRPRSASRATTSRPRSCPHYVDSGIVERSPFATIDEQGVGELVQIAVERGRAARPGLEVGICGEHGGDPASIRFFHRGRARLRQLLAVPRADRAGGGGAGRGRAALRPGSALEHALEQLDVLAQSPKPSAASGSSATAVTSGPAALSQRRPPGRQRRSDQPAVHGR